MGVFLCPVSNELPIPTYKCAAGLRESCLKGGKAGEVT